MNRLKNDSFPDYLYIENTVEYPNNLSIEWHKSAQKSVHLFPKFDY